jgi:transcriptional regulator GlxA family with amidase domain
VNFAIVLFPDVEELDFAGPLEVFGMASRLLWRDWRVFTVAEEPVVRAVSGLTVQVDHTFHDAPPADVVIVPGGFGTRPGMDNEKLIGYIKRAGESAAWVTSVCTGAFLLHRAGFLQGKRATTHWASRAELAKLGGTDVVEERWVHEGNVITAAGVSAGIDGALYLVGQLKSPRDARNLQKMIEYDPQPPYADVAV